MLAHALLETLILSPFTFPALLSLLPYALAHRDRETHLHRPILIYIQDLLTISFEDVPHVPLIVKMVVTEHDMLFFPTGLEKTFFTKPWVRERPLNKLKMCWKISRCTTNWQKAIKNVCRDVLVQSHSIYLRASLFWSSDSLLFSEVQVKAISPCKKFPLWISMDF